MTRISRQRTEDATRRQQEKARLKALARLWQEAEHAYQGLDTVPGRTTVFIRYTATRTEGV